MILRAPLLAWVVGVSLAPGLVAAAERITHFEARIAVATDGTVDILERIDVVAEGAEIRRGIFRDLPTDYERPDGVDVVIDYTVHDVRRDGGAEPYRIEDRGADIRIYIGDPDRLIAHGPHSYEIAYETHRQVGFFEHFDELYWNVTGNRWAFPIERAVGVLCPPAGAPVEQHAAYTGRFGATGTDYAAFLRDDGCMQFETTRPLARGEGLTIAVAWPKGYVTPPTTGERAAWLLRDNLDLLVAVVGFVLVLAYYLFAWNRVGRDPDAGTIVPLFEPPDGLSPAAVRFVRLMDGDPKGFTAAILSMAVKGALTIEDDGDDYELKRGPTAEDALSRGERAVMRKLFSSTSSVAVSRSNQKRLKRARDALQTALDAEYESTYFRRNFRHLVPGLALTVLALIAIVLASRDIAGTAFMSVWLSVWITIGTVILLKSIARLRHEWVHIIPAAFSLIILGVGAVLGLAGYADLTSWPTAFAMLLLAGLNGVFYELMKAPTKLGRTVMDRIEGFRLFLSVAEKDRMNLLNPPEQTPELFERFLPYALALDVEQEWSEQFARVLAKAAAEDDYRPSWYRGRSYRQFDASRMAARLGGSLTSAVARASAPASSSGSGGGGSSGGGGGGGGGGGW